MKHLLLTLLMVFPGLLNSSVGQNNWVAQLEEYINLTEPAIPLIEPLISERIREVSVCKGDAGNYYLTGVLQEANPLQIGVRVWQSTDLKKWSLLGDNGFVWELNANGLPWQKKMLEGARMNPDFILSSKIHYFQRTFWITYSYEPFGVSGVLISKTGRAEGPYQEINNTGPLVRGLNASLIEDTEKQLWLVWGRGEYQKINDELDGLASGTLSRIKLPSSAVMPQRFNIAHINNRIHLTFSQWNTAGALIKPYVHELPNARFDAMIMSANSLHSVFSEPKLFIPHGGVCNIITDFESKPKAIVSAENDPSSPFRGNPAAVPVHLSVNGWAAPLTDYPILPDTSTRIIYVSKEGSNSNGSSWANAYTSIQRALDQSSGNTQIWISQGVYEAPVRINLKKGVYLFGGFKGDETLLEQRDIKKYPVTVNGRRNIFHVFFISSSSHIRLDGLTIRGGNANGQSFSNRYGGGLNLLGGGETIRIVNCIFEENIADQDGGAIYASLGAAPIIINCIIRNNHAKNNGGAIAFYSNSFNGYHPQIYNSLIERNKSANNGGAIYFDTDQVRSGLLTMVNCIVSNNSTAGQNGIVTLDRNSSLYMNHCTVALNTAPSGHTAAIRFGRVPANHLVMNSIFFQNEGDHLFNIEGDFPSALKIKRGNAWVQLVNNTFSSNNTSSIIYRNFDGKQWRNATEVNESGMGMQNNEHNPDFVDPFRGDFSLKANSPIRNKSIIIDSFPFDIYGNKRILGPNSSGFDPGAIQSVQ